MAKRRRQGSWSILWRLLGLVAPFKFWVALAALMGFGTIASSIGLMSASAYIIASAALQPSIAVLQVAIVGVRFFGLSRGVFRYLERYTSHQVTFRLLARLRVWFFTALEPLAPARLMQFRSGDLLARIVGDIEILENFYVRALAPPLVAVLVALAAALFIGGYDRRLALALLGVLILAGVGLSLLARWLGRGPGRRLVHQRAKLNVALVDGIQGMADLLAYDRGQAQIERIEMLSRVLGNTQRQMARWQGLQNALGILLSNLGMWVVLVLAIPLVTSGKINGVSLAVVTLAALTSFEAVLPLPLAFQYLESNLEAARRLFEIVDAQPLVVEPAQPAVMSGRYDLEVELLTFTYPEPVEDHTAELLPALEEVSFRLAEGQRLAVVGPSGAGKSTLVHLLLRFWDYQHGQIRLGGVSLDRLDPNGLRQKIAVVSQNTHLFNATVRENLLIARPKATQAEIVAATELAQIHSFIETLPQGYDTYIGESGHRWSGGERQRLAIARALLKDAPLLVLDEATANLDALTERRVWESLHMLMNQRTTLVITHRLVGLETMDEILVLERGRVIEQGKHASLLAQDGLYRRMWELQTQWLE